MYTNVLVPFDGSESANKALAAAIEMGAGPVNVDLTVLLVTNSNSEETSFKVAMRMAGATKDECDKLDVMHDNALAAYKEQMRERISKFFESIPENIDVKIVVKKGAPREVICDYANDEENAIDCIVMGRRGLGGIRASLGSVSTAVLRNTDLPVMVVK